MGGLGLAKYPMYKKQGVGFNRREWGRRQLIMTSITWVGLLNTIIRIKLSFLNEFSTFIARFLTC